MKMQAMGWKKSVISAVRQGPEKENS